MNNWKIAKIKKNIIFFIVFIRKIECGTIFVKQHVIIIIKSG